MKVNVKINKIEYVLEVNPNATLVDALRNAGFKSVKTGCREGMCGACTVMINGKPKNSCLVLAGQAEGAEILTVEGMGTPDNPHILQEKFVESGSTQCGFCNPGSLISAKALLDSNKKPTIDDIKEALDGNLCRCTGYVKRIGAILEAAEVMNQTNKKSTKKVTKKVKKTVRGKK